MVSLTVKYPLFLTPSLRHPKLSYLFKKKLSFLKNFEIWTSNFFRTWFGLFTLFPCSPIFGGKEREMMWMLPWIMDLWIYCDILLYLVAWLPQRPSSAEIVDATIASIVIFTMRCTTANDHNRTGNADHDIPFTCGLELILYVYAPLAVIICLFFGNYNSKFKKNPKISKIFKYSQNFHWPGVYNIKHNLVRSCFQFWL